MWQVSPHNNKHFNGLQALLEAWDTKAFADDNHTHYEGMPPPCDPRAAAQHLDNIWRAIRQLWVLPPKNRAEPFHYYEGSSHDTENVSEIV